MTATSEPSAQQSGINHVPGVREAMFRVDDVSCDSAPAVSSMRTGARTLAKRTAVVRLARRSDHRDLGRLLLPIRAGTSTLTAQGRAVHLGATADLRRGSVRDDRRRTIALAIQRLRYSPGGLPGLAAATAAMLADSSGAVPDLLDVRIRQRDDVAEVVMPGRSPLANPMGSLSSL